MLKRYGIIKLTSSNVGGASGGCRWPVCKSGRLFITVGYFIVSGIIIPKNRKRRLYDKNKYTIPKSAKKDLEVYKAENNINIEFFNEHCIRLLSMPGENWELIDTKSKYTKAQIFNSFSNWAKENYKCYPSRKDFETTISEILGIPVEELSTRTACKRVYNGFDITEECFNEYCRL